MENKFKAGDLVNIIGTDEIYPIAPTYSEYLAPYATNKDGVIRWHAESELQPILTFLQERYKEEVEYVPLDGGGNLCFFGNNISTGLIADSPCNGYWITGQSGFIFINGKLAEVIEKKEAVTPPQEKQYDYEVVHCTTQEQWDFVSEKLGYNFDEYDAYWNRYDDQSCINLNELQFGDVVGWQKNNSLIYTFEEWCKKFGHEVKEEKKEPILYKTTGIPSNDVVMSKDFLQRLYDNSTPSIKQELEQLYPELNPIPNAEDIVEALAKWTSGGVTNLLSIITSAKRFVEKNKKSLDT